MNQEFEKQQTESRQCLGESRRVPPRLQTISSQCECTTARRSGHPLCTRRPPPSHIPRTALDAFPETQSAIDKHLGSSNPGKPSKHNPTQQQTSTRTRSNASPPYLPSPRQKHPARTQISVSQQTTAAAPPTRHKPQQQHTWMNAPTGRERVGLLHQVT